MEWKLYLGIALILFATFLLTWRGSKGLQLAVEGFAVTQTDITNLATAITAQSTVLDTYTIKTLVPMNTVLKGVPVSQRYLVNVAPITITYTGYLGAGLLDATEFFKHALGLGIRSFILPISTYKDDNKIPPIWPTSGSPAVVYRDSTNRITSKNGLNVKKIATALANALSVSSPQQEEPILLKLEQVLAFVPDSNTDEAKYVDFMTQIADGLEPLLPRILTQLGPYGTAVGGVAEDKILLQTPLSDLAGKVIITTDFDVGKYDKDKYAKTTPSLLKRIHFRVRNTPAQGKISSYKTTPLSSVSSTFDTDQARTTLYEARGATNTDVDAVTLALSKGVQIIPLPLFESGTAENALALIEPWKGAAWKVKPEDERYTKPAPVVPAKPSQKMNARVASNAQPGQVVISN